LDIFFLLNLLSLPYSVSLKFIVNSSLSMLIL